MASRGRRALLCHGLNQNPATLRALAQLLEELGFEATILVLKGHSPTDHEALKEVVAADWVNACAETLSRLTPELVLGFSLGAGVILEALEIAQPKSRPKFGVFIAPSFGAKWYSALSSLAAMIAPRVVLAGKSPEAYRAGAGTAVAAYAAHESIRKSLWSRSTLAFAPYRSLILLSQGDELISAARAKKFAARRLPGAQIEMLAKKEDKVRPRRLHLIVDEPSMGVDAWQKLKSLVQGLVRAP